MPDVRAWMKAMPDVRAWMKAMPAVRSWMNASVATRPPQYGVLRIVVVLFAFLFRKRTATLGK